MSFLHGLSRTVNDSIRAKSHVRMVHYFQSRTDLNGSATIGQVKHGNDTEHCVSTAYDLRGI